MNPLLIFVSNLRSHKKHCHIRSLYSLLKICATQKMQSIMDNLGGDYGRLLITLPFVVHYGIKNRQMEILHYVLGHH